MLVSLSFISVLLKTGARPACTETRSLLSRGLAPHQFTSMQKYQTQDQSSTQHHLNQYLNDRASPHCDHSTRFLNVQDLQPAPSAPNSRGNRHALDKYLQEPSDMTPIFPSRHGTLLQSPPQIPALPLKIACIPASWHGALRLYCGCSFAQTLGSEERRRYKYRFVAVLE